MSRARILVVDDSEDLLEFYVALFESAGYDVTTASDGEKGFHQAKQTRPDLIVSDVVMPNLDGLELLVKLRSELAPPLPAVILCSGFDTVEPEALRRGARLFLHKPVDAPVLLAQVERVLGFQPISRTLAETARRHASAAREQRRRSSAALVHQLEERGELPKGSLRERLRGPLDWLRAYFKFGNVMMALLYEDGLHRVASTDDAGEPRELDIGALPREVLAVLETGAALVVSDLRAHCCFSGIGESLAGFRFFATAPLTTDAGAPIGVLCAADDGPRTLELEDLSILQHVARRGSLLLGQLAAGCAGDAPGHHGPGVLFPRMFEVVVGLELQSLERSGGSMALAMLPPVDAALVAQTIAGAADRERLVAAVLVDDRVAVLKRDRATGAAQRIEPLLQKLASHASCHAVGMVDLEGGALAAFDGRDLLHFASVALDRAVTDGGGVRRVDLREDSMGAAP